MTDETNENYGRIPYYPERWQGIRIKLVTGEIIDKILGSWYGGYMLGNSWRMSSEIESVEEDSDDPRYLKVKNKSGSIYVLHKDAVGAHSDALAALAKLRNHNMVESVEMFDTLPFDAPNTETE